MTCIVGMVDGNRIVMGGDSAETSGSDITIRKDEKVFVNGEFLIGFTTSFRMGQLLRYKFKPPLIPEDMDLFEYMVTLFVDGVRDTLQDGGFARKEKEAESGGFFLVGIRGRLFEIEPDYQVAEISDGFASIGCGASYAKGSLITSMNSSAEYRVMLALKAAEHFSAGVRGPFAIRSTT